MKSVRTTEERQLLRKLVDDAIHNSREFFDSLNAAEKETALTIFQELQENNGYSLTYDFLWELHYKEKPVPIWDFLDDKFYAGWVAPDLYPKWREVIEEVLAPGSQYYEIILCLSGDTHIPLLSGSVKTLKELYKEFERTNRAFWVYSVDQKSGEIVPGKCTKVTKFDKDRLYKVILQDGSYFRANANHEMVCRDRIKRKIRDLKPGDELMPFSNALYSENNYSDCKIQEIKIDNYENVYCLTVPIWGNFAILTDSQKGVFSGNTGSIGSGKCVEKNTLIPTSNGIHTIESIVHSKNKNQVYSESGLRDIISFHDEGITETRKIITSHGHILEGRPNHRVRVLNNLEIQWKCLDELKKGDCLIEQPLENFNGNELPDAIAELAGWYIAEGDYVGNRYAFILQEYEVDYVFELANNTHCAVSKQDNIVFVSKTDSFRLKLDSIDKIPDFILGASRKSIALFFKGLFSGEGSSNGNTIISFSTIFEKLARQSQVLLTLMGYQCSVVSTKYEYQKSCIKPIPETVYIVSIEGDVSRRKFIEEIGFWDGYKQKKSLYFNLNTDSRFNFRFSNEDTDKLRSMQIVSDDYILTRLIESLKVQDCTTALLNKIKERGGILPDILNKIASGELLFDTVKEVKKSEAHCYDLTVDGDPSYNSNGFISHNSHTAALIYTYLIYKISCLKNPAKYYDLIEGSKIIFGIYSVTKTQVKDVGYGIVRTYLEKTPYFQVRFPFDHRILKKIVFKENNIEVVLGSQEFHVLGMNVFSMYLDEVNFMDDKISKSNKGFDIRDEQGQAHEIYNAARSRIKSRFMRPGGSVPGMTILISSKTHNTSFLENHIRKYKDEIEAKKVFVADFARWEVQPQSRFILPKFKVQIGNTIHPSKILDDNEIPESGTEVIEVPGEFREEFEVSPERALREIAGVSTTGISPLFRDKKPILECIDKSRKHPFTKEIIAVSHLSDIEITDYLINDEVFNIVDGEYVPKISPRAARVLHLDLALNKDRAGIAMGHISGMRKVKKMRTDRTFYFDYEPEIVVDLVLAVQLLNRGQIDYGKIRAFIFSLASYGFRISVITADRFQSADTLQIFEKAGWETGIQSVDTTPEPYLYLKQAIIDKRISFYNYPLLIQELSKLEIDLDANKIDHPIGGSKDAADAVAGMVFTSMKLKNAMPKNQILHAATMNYDVGEVLPSSKLRADSGKVIVEGKMQVNMDVLADEVLKYLKQKEISE